MDHNSSLKTEINGHLEYLLKKIGNNRQQLSTKVITFYRDINKELNKEKVSAERKEEILKEVGALERIAANQLPHYDWYTPDKAPVRKPEPAPKPESKPATKLESKPAAKAEPAAKVKKEGVVKKETKVVTGGAKKKK